MKTTILFKLTTDAPLDAATLDDLCTEGGAALTKLLGGDKDQVQTILGYYYCTGTVRVLQKLTAKGHHHRRRV